MDCPNCGTWNPDDKRQCWKCDAPLPKPEPPKRKRKPINWVWIAVGFFVLITLVQTCMAMQARQGQSPVPTGYLPGPETRVVWTVNRSLV